MNSFATPVARKIRKDRPHVPVLFISGHPHDVLVSRGALEPGVDLLMKPFSSSTLLGRVHAPR